jgi:hypothetical protein
VVNNLKNIDYRLKVTVPIRDSERDDLVVFCVDVYGVTYSDLAVIPMGAPGDDFIGSKPMRRAIERLGLDLNRFRASIWDFGAHL